MAELTYRHKDHLTVLATCARIESGKEGVMAIPLCDCGLCDDWRAALDRAEDVAQAFIEEHAPPCRYCNGSGTVPRGPFEERPCQVCMDERGYSTGRAR